jgi:hypothetical protein
MVRRVLAQLFKTIHATRIGMIGLITDLYPEIFECADAELFLLMRSFVDFNTAALKEILCTFQTCLEQFFNAFGIFPRRAEGRYLVKIWKGVGTRQLPCGASAGTASFEEDLPSTTTNDC